eukprot:Platyproteum_vivax@DN14155_c0_g1_i1.p1
MYWDLNVQWNDKKSVMLDGAAKLGFSGVAFNVDVDASMLASHRCPIENVTKQADGGDVVHMVEQWHDLGVNISAPVMQLRRITVAMSSANQIAAINQVSKSDLIHYELFAVVPTTEQAFQALVNSGNCDIISLNLTGKMFNLRRQQLGVAVSRGIFFEVCINDALFDPIRRRHLFQNVDSLTRFVPHDKIIFTSGARTPIEMRSPMDLINIATVAGLANNHNKSVVASACIGVMHRAAARRSHGGIISLAASSLEHRPVRGLCNTRPTSKDSPKDNKNKRPFSPH